MAVSHVPVSPNSWFYHQVKWNIMEGDFTQPLLWKLQIVWWQLPGGCMVSLNWALVILACAGMRQPVFPHMAWNMLTSCCQSVTSCLPHQQQKWRGPTPHVQQNSSRWRIFWVRARAIVTDTSEWQLFLSMCPLTVQSGTVQEDDLKAGLAKESFITDVRSSACTLWWVVVW